MEICRITSFFKPHDYIFFCFCYELFNDFWLSKKKLMPAFNFLFLFPVFFFSLTFDIILQLSSLSLFIILFLFFLLSFSFSTLIIFSLLSCTMYIIISSIFKITVISLLCHFLDVFCSFLFHFKFRLQICISFRVIFALFLFSLCLLFVFILKRMLALCFFYQRQIHNYLFFLSFFFFYFEAILI